MSEVGRESLSWLHRADVKRATAELRNIHGAEVSTSGLIWLAPAALLAGVGLFWFLAALFPRRRGDEPRCRSCGYNLTGISSERCPECGQALVGGAVVRGTRRRRPLLAVCGLLCFALGAAPFSDRAYQHFRRVDWYQFKPTGWVIGDLRSAQPKTRLRAKQYLRKRFDDDRISRGQQHRIAELCLADQARLRMKIGYWAAEMLGRLYESGGLSDDQQRRMFENMQVWEFDTRSVYVKGRRAPLGVHTLSRAPPGVFWARGSLGPIQFDGEPITTGTGSIARGGCQAEPMAKDVHMLRLPRRGAHVLSADLTIEVFEGPYDIKTEAGRLVHTSRRTVSAAVRVVDQIEDAVGTVRSAELDKALAFGVKPLAFRARRVGAGEELWRLSGRIEIKKIGVGVAFDVWAEFDPKRRIRLGRITARKQRTGVSVKSVEARVRGPVPRYVTIVLTPSREAALATLRLDEIWGGELRFEDVPVGE